MGDDGRLKERGLPGGKHGHKNPVKGLLKGGRKKFQQITGGRKGQNGTMGRTPTPDRQMKDMLLNMGQPSDKFARHGGPGMVYYGAALEELEEQRREERFYEQQRRSTPSPLAESEPRFIKLQNGNVIKLPGSFTGYHSDDEGMSQALEASKSTLSSDNLLREALSLRLDLEQELEDTLARKEELLRCRRRMDTEMQSLGQSDMFEKSVMEYSTRHKEVTAKLRETETTISPLQTAIADLRQVEKFIKEQHLGNEEAAIVFQDIMKKMFDDLHLSQTPPSKIKPAHSLPGNVMAELKDRLEHGTLTSMGRQSSGFGLQPTSSSTSDSTQWVTFGDDQESSATSQRKEGPQHVGRVGSAPNVKGAWDKLNQLKTISGRNLKKRLGPQLAQGISFPDLASSGAFREPELPTYYPSTYAPPPSGRSSRADSSSIMDSGSIMAVDEVKQWQDDPMVTQSRGTGMCTPPPSQGPLASTSMSSLSSMDTGAPSSIRSFDGTLGMAQPPQQQQQQSGTSYLQSQLGMPQQQLARPAGSWMRFGDGGDVQGSVPSTGVLHAGQPAVAAHSSDSAAGLSQVAMSSTALQASTAMGSFVAVQQSDTQMTSASASASSSSGFHNFANFEANFSPVASGMGRHGASASASGSLGLASEADWVPFGDSDTPSRGQSTGGMGGNSSGSQYSGAANPTMLQSAPSTSSTSTVFGGQSDSTTSTSMGQQTGPRSAPEAQSALENAGSCKTEEAAKNEPGESASSMASVLKSVKLKKKMTSTDAPYGGEESQQSFDIGNMDMDTLVSAMMEGAKQDVKPAKEAAVPQPEEAEPAAPKPKKAAPPPPPPPPGKGGKGGPPPPPPPPGKKGGKAPVPPPPPGGKRTTGDTGVKRQPQVIEMFQEVRRALLSNSKKPGEGHKKLGGASGPVDQSQMFAEIASKGSYQAQVQADIIKYADVIEELINEVKRFKARDMEHLEEFVNGVDKVLDELSDETAVLRKFEWPASRFDTFREAVALSRELTEKRNKFKQWQRGQGKRADNLKEIQKYMEKVQDRMDVLNRTKESDEARFKNHDVPWNKKLMTEVKHASLHAMDLYMQVALDEAHEAMKSSLADKKKREKALAVLTATIKFAFKVHQCVGGFNEGCSARFGEVSALTRQLTSERDAEGSAA
ncbi:unnamed protein product [Ostreobium quekettii]|uniref:Uncharacterized protein n=1 Tax=Ostreobium quekettii TaxID=121088 RepID=A0A8S1INA6_9CHLO|nr:unnamed protein product [Ostreobium quekettii]